MKIVQLKLTNWLDNYFKYDIIPGDRIDFGVYMKLFDSISADRIEMIKF